MSRRWQVNARHTRRDRAAVGNSAGEGRNADRKDPAPAGGQRAAIDNPAQKDQPPRAGPLSLRLL